MTDARDGDDVDAQAQYDADPDLQALLTEAAQSPTVHRDDDADHDNDADDGAAWVDRLRTGRRLREVTGVDDSDVDDRPVGGMS